MAKDGTRKERGRRSVKRALGFLLLVAGLLGGLVLYWVYVYLPSQILTAINTERVATLDAGAAEVPAVLRKYFRRALPHLVRALSGDDDGAAALAFVALRHGMKDADRDALGFDPHGEGEGKFRCALLLERKLGAEAPVALSPEFEGAFLRWKAAVRPGAFGLDPVARIEACRDLFRLEGEKAVPFLLDRLRDPTTAPGEKLPVAVLLTSGPHAVEAYDLLVRSGIPPAFFLSALMRRDEPWARTIMERAFASADPGEKDVAVDYLLRHPDRRAAALLESLARDAELDADTRANICWAILVAGESWAADWVWGAMASWKAQTVGRVLSRISFVPPPGMGAPARTLPPRGVLEVLLARASADPRAGVPSEALNAWIALDGDRAFAPFGAVEVVLAGDPLAALEVPAGGLLRKPVPFRRNWAERTLLGFRALESGGLLARLARDPLDAVVKAGADYLETPPPSAGGEEEIRFEIARLVGMVLARHGTLLADRERVAAAYRTAASDGRNPRSTRLEAAFWLALAGEASEDVVALLWGGMRDEAPSLRFGCAAALAGLQDAARRSGTDWPHPDPREVLEEAWRGSNPLLCFLAARETPNLPDALLPRAVEPMLRAAQVEAQDLRDLARAGRTALEFLLCVPAPEAVSRARWVVEKKVPGGLRTVWADLVGVPSDPEGDVGVLERIVAVLGDTQRDPGTLRAAILLLRAWTGRRFGYDFLHRDRSHAVEIAGRWRAWIEANREALDWDAERGRFVAR